MKIEQLPKIISATKRLKSEIINKMLSRDDLFVQDSNICILTSIEKQSGAKIAAFIRRMKEESGSILEYGGPLLQFSDLKTKKNVPEMEIDLYIKCDDEKLSDKSRKILSALYDEFLLKGIHIKLHSLSGSADNFAVAVNKMINNYQIMQIQKSTKQTTK